MKSKMLNSAELVRQFESAFKCPHCGSPMRVVDFKSVVCTNNHTFDFAKTGYLNLMTRPANSQYKKELFEARHRAIVESNLYSPLHQRIAAVIRERLDVDSDRLKLLDVGCGEGSHLQKIIDECRSRTTMTGVGLDIAKEGIVLASKRYEDSVWLVGDLANSPFQDHVFPIVVNILSPSNYGEFKRLLTQEGLVIKVIPRTDYLKELRDELLGANGNSVYNNEKTRSLFQEHFQMVESSEVRYTKQLSHSELHDIVQMTPLAWSADRERINHYVDQESAEITVDLEILIGMNRR